MTDVNTSAPSRQVPRRFGAFTIALHWLTAALIVGMFASAWSMSLTEDAEQASALLTLHRSLGLSVWIVTLARLSWRATFMVLPPFPPRMSRTMQWAAKMSEYLLYVLLLLQPLTGFAQSVARGKPFALMAFQVPALMERRPDLTSIFEDIHAYSALALLSLVALHVLAALFHRYVVRDDVLQSMLPWRPGRVVRRVYRSSASEPMAVAEPHPEISAAGQLRGVR